MNPNRIATVGLLIAALFVCSAMPVLAAQSLPPVVRPGNNALAARGFNELYNMDYDPAIRDFTRLKAEYPDDPFPTNYLLSAEMFKELNRIGAMDTETYSSESFLTGKARRPLDMAAQKRIFDLIARVESLCDSRLQKNPRDTDALYARGMATGYRAIYMAMAQKSWMSAIRAAFASRRDHEHVLEIDSNYVDAKTTVGIHNYIIGALNWAERAAVALVGVTGNKQKGLAYLREVSRSNGVSRNDAAMALSLFLRGEQLYPEAMDLVGRISREYPRNYLLAAEYAHLLNAAGHGREAMAQYRIVLQNGREGKYSTFRPEIAAWGLGVSARGQRDYQQAAEAFDLVTASYDVEPSLLDRAALAAGEMYDTLGQRDQAVARYRKVIAGGHDDDAMIAARRHLRHAYRFTG